ncbi:MAG TPA: MarR family transcriptional regulator, partial [Candidatus Methanoperedenaceae archaeon]|nr:MarR family transcriptional regulator [Candidatus Methanoperedenaceae archaeon]
MRSAQVEALPPSVKFVFKLLELRGQLTQKDLISETQLPPRTVRYALGRLKKSGLIEERLNIRDGRQCLYGIRNM